MATHDDLANFTHGQLKDFKHDELKNLSLEELVNGINGALESPSIPKGLKSDLRSIADSIIASATYDMIKSIDWNSVLLRFLEFLKTFSD